MTRKTSYNNTYPKVAVQWLNQALCFYQIFCLDDSEVLRNRNHREAAKHKVKIENNNVMKTVIVIKIIISIIGVGLFCSCSSTKIEKQKGINLSQSTTKNQSNSDVHNSNVFVTRPSQIILTGFSNYRLFAIYKVNFDSKGKNGWIGTNQMYNSNYETADDSLNCWHNNFLPGLTAIYGYNLVNISHYDLNKNKTIEFFETPVLINSIYYPSLKQDTLNGKPIKRDYFLVSVYCDDTNKDSIINNKDLRRLYRFNLDGTKKELLIPLNYSVLSSEYDYANDIMFIYAKEDTNSNGNRDENEPIQIFRLDLKRPQTAQKIYK